MLHGYCSQFLAYCELADFSLGAFHPGFNHQAQPISNLSKNTKKRYVKKVRYGHIIDNDFRARADKAGYGYQTMINESLREYLAKSGKPLHEAVIRQVIREELDWVAHH